MNDNLDFTLTKVAEGRGDPNPRAIVIARPHSYDPELVVLTTNSFAGGEHFTYVTLTNEQATALGVALIAAAAA